MVYFHDTYYRKTTMSGRWENYGIRDCSQDGTGLFGQGASIITMGITLTRVNSERE